MSSGILDAQSIDYTPPEGYEDELSAAEYAAFVDEAVRVVEGQFPVVGVAEGVVRLAPGAPYSALNLHNLIAKYAAASSAERASVIVDHFAAVFDAPRQQEAFDPRDFAAVAPYLSLRIYPSEFVARNGGSTSLLTREDLEGTQTLLMLDLPSTFTPVPQEVFKLWDKTATEVFAVAQANVNRHPFVSATETLPTASGSFEAHFIENADYGASIALDLATNAPEFVGELGSVVAIPNKGVVNVCKVSRERPLDFVHFVQQLTPVVAQFHDQHPQPVSRSFFWFYEGRFTKIHVEDTGGAISVTAPARLSELLTEGTKED